MRIHKLVIYLTLLTCIACKADDAGQKQSASQRDAASADKGHTTDNDPMSSYLGAAAIGVSDLEQSQTFYSEVFGLSLRYKYVAEGRLEERILYFEKGKPDRGGDVVLMHYTDGNSHKYTNNPVRLVFYVADVAATTETIRGRGLDIVSEPHPEPTFNDAIIGVGRDPDGYLLELIEDKSLDVPYLTALGLGVSDLDASKAFYTNVLGMRVSGDITHVPGVWDEWILEYPSGKGSSLVVMHYVDDQDHDYTDLPVKSVHFVGDSRAMTAKVKAEGLAVTLDPQVLEVNGSKSLIGLATDRDGYTIEFVTPQSEE